MLQGTKRAPLNVEAIKLMPTPLTWVAHYPSITSDGRVKVGVTVRLRGNGDRKEISFPLYFNKADFKELQQVKEKSQISPELSEVPNFHNGFVVVGMTSKISDRRDQVVLLTKKRLANALGTSCRSEADAKQALEFDEETKTLFRESVRLDTLLALLKPSMHQSEEVLNFFT